MALAKESMAKTLREIADALESEVVKPSILKEVEIVITKFPMVEVLTCPEDKLSQCPPEILEEVLQYLSPKDLKSALLVNKKLCVVGSKPKFWSRSKVSLQSLDAGVGFLESERKVSCLEATSLPSEESLELLMAMSSNSTLREVSLQDCLMDQVEPTLLPMALSNLVKVDFSNSILGEQQLSAIFSFMASGCKIASLNLEEVDLSSVAPELLSCTSKLLELNLSSTLMTNEQSRVLWNAIVEEEDCNFTIFEMNSVNLENAEVEAPVKVARKVSKLGLGNTSLTPLQAIAIITAFDGNLALQEVDMSDLALSGIESRFFAKVFSGTKKLNLANAGLTALQVSQLLEVQSEEGSLEDLDLSANQLGMINAELMSISMNKMRSVTLLDSGITMNQVEQNCELIQSLFSLNSGCSDSHSKSGKNLTHHFLGLSQLAHSIFSALSFGFTVYQINCCRRTGARV